MAAFHVPDMTCGHCVATIRKALETALPGATTEIELAEHLVRVDGDAATARQALVDAGYTPEAVT